MVSNLGLDLIVWVEVEQNGMMSGVLLVGGASLKLSVWPNVVKDKEIMFNVVKTNLLMMVTRLRKLVSLLKFQL